MAEVLVKMSKVKELTKLRTSASVKTPLSTLVAQVVGEAEKIAKEEGIGTIKDRHIEAAIERMKAP